MGHMLVDTPFPARYALAHGPSTANVGKPLLTENNAQHPLDPRVLGCRVQGFRIWGFRVRQPCGACWMVSITEKVKTLFFSPLQPRNAGGGGGRGGG